MLTFTVQTWSWHIVTLGYVPWVEESHMTGLNISGAKKCMLSTEVMEGGGEYISAEQQYNIPIKCNRIKFFIINNTTNIILILCKIKCRLNIAWVKFDIGFEVHILKCLSFFNDFHWTEIRSTYWKEETEFFLCHFSRLEIVPRYVLWVSFSSSIIPDNG